MEPCLFLSFNSSYLEMSVQSGCLVLQLEGSPFSLSCQEVLDHVVQFSVKVRGQGVAIHLRVLAVADESCMVFCH